MSLRKRTVFVASCDGCGVGPAWGISPGQPPQGPITFPSRQAALRALTGGFGWRARTGRLGGIRELYCATCARTRAAGGPPGAHPETLRPLGSAEEALLAALERVLGEEGTT